MKPGCVNFIGATSQDNGITARIANDGFRYPANTITVSYNGSVGEAFYQEEGYWASDDINVLVPRFKLNREIALYVCSLIRQVGRRYAYTFKWTREIMENDTICVPVNSFGAIDFDYMESFIRALEGDRIREMMTDRARALEAYLAAAGFGDCELTDAEQQAVQSVADGEVEMREFKVAELFSVETPKRRFNANAVRFGGTRPYVVRTSLNNGRRGTIVADEAWLNPGDTISFGQDTATIFYQPDAYFTGDKIKVMRPLSGTLGERAACYLLAAMRKAFSTFAWGRSSFGEKVLKDVAVRLPVTPSGEIDRDLMEAFVSGTMKQAIRGVVAWKDREIAAAKQAVGT